jgi:hypothetical protein
VAPDGRRQQGIQTASQFLTGATAGRRRRGLPLHANQVAQGQSITGINAGSLSNRGGAEAH